MDRRSHNHIVGNVGRNALVELRLGLASHLIIGTSKIAYRSIARTIREQGCGKHDAVARGCLLDNDGRNLAALLVYGQSMVWCIERNVLFGIDERVFLGVFVIVCRHGIATAGMPELTYHTTDRRIQTCLADASEVDTNLLTIVSAQYGTVID